MSRPPYRDEAWLREKYVGEGLSQSEIADLCDVHQVTILNWLRRHGIDARPKNGDGPEVASFSHDRGWERWTARNGQGGFDHVYVHRLAAVAWFGYDAVAGSVVHHDPNIPWLNAEWALHPMSQAEHVALHEPHRRRYRGND